jgi:hypothetical protein
MIHIAARLFDLDGWLSVQPLGPIEDQIRRRVSRTATLDGGAAVSDRGFSHADRTFVITYRPKSRDDEARARRLVELHAKVTVSTSEGVFLAVPQNFEAGELEHRITVLIVELLSEI